MPAVSNMWRIGNDIHPDWSDVLRLIDIDREHASAAGAGSWNDADMLEVGNGMSTDQDRAHFSMWCLLASPLIAGNDPREMSKATTGILTNKWAIAVSQDPLGIQGTLAASSANNQSQVWSKQLVKGYAVVLLNRDTTQTANITLQFSQIGSYRAYEAFDVWDQGRSIGVYHGAISVTLPMSSTAFYQLSPI
eukprot:TRINITY_DN29940_c0_g1_i1.p1 TRINITY_DN29940_c0_g1~~TRINITY_DN29940_c0_g1_i1.p1  ORF type:complete len:192 (+),score=11.68 TRINITY_DN29940_c0_g1_i1:81-656(+)